MANIRFLKKEDFDRQKLKSKRRSNYKKVCIILVALIILENAYLLYYFNK